MLDRRRVAAQSEEKREQLFIERYEDLLAWALRLTNQQRESAEDLVQDAFVQFVLSQTSLEKIGNIDGYLRKMLRYMHVARTRRSRKVLGEELLSVADYDSWSSSWTTVEPSRRIQASEDLYQLCAYACARKESSKAGSVFILRFFHDYLPIEIARVLNTTRHCVDQWQILARREAKQFMSEPQRLRPVDIKNPRLHIKDLKNDCELMLRLRRMIFDSCSGECLSQQEFDHVYLNGNREALATRKLAHVVSCRKCLDEVNRLLASTEPNPGIGSDVGSSLLADVGETLMNLNV